MGALDTAMTDFAIFEFSGLPKSGKSTTIEIVATYLRRCGYNVALYHDDGTYAPIGKSDLGTLNIYLAGQAINSVLELAHAKARTPTVLLLDRGIFDRLTFSSVLENRGIISENEHKDFSNFLKMQRLTSLIAGVFVFTAPTECVLRREFLNALHDINGKVMNNSFLDEFRKSSLRLAVELSDYFESIEVIDTGKLDGLIRVTARKVAISIEMKLGEIGFKDSKVVLPELEKHGDFLISKTDPTEVAHPYFVKYEGNNYFRYMNALYAPDLAEKLGPNQIVKLCELRNLHSSLTIDRDFNRVLAKIGSSYIKRHFGSSSSLLVLDFGCGDGLSIELLQEQDLGAQFTGCDPSILSIEIAQKKGCDAFHFSSGAKWDLGGRKFDCATAFFVMHFDIAIEDIAELRRHVKDDGIFLFNIYNGSVDAVSEKLQKSGWSRPEEIDSRQLGKAHQVYVCRAM